MLQLVPVLSIFFLLTTAAGSALWAARLEDLEAETDGRSRANRRGRPNADAGGDAGTMSRSRVEEV